MKLSDFGYSMRDMIYKIFSCKFRGIDLISSSENTITVVTEGIEYTLTITQKKAEKIVKK